MKSITYIIVISILLASIGQVASDLYLPSMPAITRVLHTSTHMVQTTMFLYMIGFSVSRLIYGPLSDAVGRKNPLITGLALCLGGTMICVFANSITMLIVGRFLQGMGSGAGVVLSAAIIRDTLAEDNLAGAFSYMSIANIVLIGSAPLVGGYLQHLFGWRASFIFIFLYTAALLLLCIFSLAETNKHKTTANLRPAQLKANLIALFTNREFLVYSSYIFLAYADIIAWLTLGPILLQNFVGLTPVGFGWMAIICGTFYGISSFVNAKLVKKIAMSKLLSFGVWGMLFAGIVMLLFALLHILNIWVVMVPMTMFTFSIGLVFPNSFAGALMPFAKFAGIASAILGCVQIAGGVVSSGIMAISPDNTQLPLALTFVACGLIGVFLAAHLVKKT